MPTDNKYLQQRNGVWFIRMRPPKEWGVKGEFIHTLRTRSLPEARRLRDRFLTPVLAETSGIGMAKSILRLLSDADESIKTQLKELGAILGDDEKKPTFLDIFEKFIRYKTSTTVKASTIKTYRATVKSFITFLGNDPIFDEITIKDIITWRDHMLEMPTAWLTMKDPKNSSKPKMSPTTINNHLSNFKAVWNWAETENHTKKKSPAKGIIAGKSKKTKTKKPITLEECDKLLEMDLPNRIKTFDKHAWYYLPRISRYTGARLAEIAQLTVDDIVTVQGVLCINITDYDDKETKNTQSVRVVPISEKLKEIMEPLLKKKKGELFKNRGDYDGRIAKYFSNRWNQEAKKIGDHCYFHGLRSFAITQMANAGVEKIYRMRIAGHTDKSSHDGYTKTYVQKLKQAVDLIP